MNSDHFTRRQLSVALAAGLGTAIAGCASDDDDGETENGDDSDENGTDGGSGEEPDVEDEGPGSLTVQLENEDGDPVSEGVEITVDLQDDALSYTYSQEIEDGEVTISLEDEGDYTVIAESTEDEFEPVEEDVSVGEDDEEITLTLEGATADGDREEDEE